MESKPRLLRYYLDQNGNNCYDDWLRGLRDAQTRSRIRVRIDRLRDGNAGDFRSLGGGLKELRLHFGPGYRVYFGEEGAYLVVILVGGDKASQAADLIRARAAWAQYLIWRNR